MKTSLSIKPPAIISIIMLLLALLPLPYGYFVLLRIVVCLSALYFAWYSYEINKPAWMWGMGFIALVFNPIIPLHFGREIWVVIDIIGAIIFGIYLIKTSKRVK